MPYVVEELVDSISGSKPSRVRAPKCNALHCRNTADRIVVECNLLGRGDFVTRLCASCLQAGKGVPGRHEGLIVLRVLRWKQVPAQRSGYVNFRAKEGVRDGV